MRKNRATIEVLAVLFILLAVLVAKSIPHRCDHPQGICTQDWGR